MLRFRELVIANKAHRACFWTWPWGHVYRVKETIYAKSGWCDLLECAVCGKTKAQMGP